MSAKRFKLTKTAKVLLMLLFVAIIGGGILAGIKTGVIKTKTAATKTESTSQKKGDAAVPDEDGNVINTDKTDEKTINLSLDEWVGWSPLVIANNGLSTQPGSIYDELGIKVNISIINDATQSSNALISGNLDAAGYTINRTAFLSKKFQDAGKNVIMPYISNFSNGGDGIIAKSSINSVNDLVGAKIGVPQFSEAHSLVMWLLNQSELIAGRQDSITIIWYSLRHRMKRRRHFSQVRLTSQQHGSRI